MPDFLPRREGDLLAFCDQFVPRVAAERVRLDLRAADVEGLVAAHAAFAASMAAVANPATRTRVGVAVKDDCKADLLPRVRWAAATLRARLDSVACVPFGLRVGRPPGGGRRPYRRIGRPTTAPRLAIGAFEGDRLRLLVRHVDAPNRLALPGDVVGAYVWAHIAPPRAADAGRAEGTGRADRADRELVDALVPPGVARWQMVGLARRARHLMPLPADARLGAELWVRAAWVTRRWESGPPSMPQCVIVTTSPSVRTPTVGRSRAA